jgi:WD40 repeat protein/DNA-binding SARP family transcriptional activator
MQLRILGPLEIVVDDEPLSLGSTKQRALVAMLAVEANHTVSLQRLVDGLWGDDPPSSAGKLVQQYVSQVRRRLADGHGDGIRIVTRGRGYELRIDPEALDVLRFERLLNEDSPREALALWRGPALTDVLSEPFAPAEASRLEERRLAALEQAIDADLANGRQREVVGELEALVREHPLNERFQAQRMLALYRSGRQGDALAAYRQARTALVDGIGVEPSAQLKRLHEAMLAQDPELVTDEWEFAVAARRVGESARRAAARREDLRASEAEVAGDVAELQRAHTRSDRDPRPSRAVVCPFKGLASFELSDAPFFFGRERLVAELVARIVGSSFLAIVGPSGSGKSSTLRAGLLAQLARGVLPGSGDWPITLLRPGEHPLTALRDAVARTPRADRRVIAIDQFEEAFTACHDGEERARFFDAIVGAATDPRQRDLFIVAMRADFYGRCAEHRELSILLGEQHVLVGRMGRDELRRAIELPAGRAGLELSRELADALIADVEAEPGALPLLSTALLELWQHRDGRRLELAVYESTGGVRGAVARLAESAFARLAPQLRGPARSLLLRLVTEDEGGAVVRRRLDRSELAGDADAERALAVLTDSRLLTAGDGEVELAHEALLREWPRLRGWLEEDAQGRRLHLHLRAAAREWEAGGRDAGELYRGARLASAIDWSTAHENELNQAERAFLAESRAASERSQRRLRAALAAVAALLAITAVAGVIALRQRADARGEATAAAAQRLGAEALVEDRVDRSLLLARQGVAMDDAVQTRGNLLAALLRTPTAIGVLHGSGSRLLSLDVSPDGRTLAMLDEDGTLSSVDTESRRPVAPPYVALGHTDAAVWSSFDDVRFSPDGSRIAVGGSAAAILDARSFRLRTGLEIGPDRFVQSLRFAPDGRIVFAIVRYVDPEHRTDAVVQRFDAADGRAVGPERPVARRLGFVSMMVTGDGRRVVTTSAETGTVIRDAMTLRPLERLPEGADRAALSPDDHTLLAGGRDGAVRFLDLHSGELRVASGRHATTVAYAAFSADGRRAITAGADGDAITWDIGRARATGTLEGHAGRISALALARDGMTFYTAGLDGNVVVWDLTGTRGLGQEFEIPAGPPPHWAPVFALSPDGRSLAIADRDGAVSLIDTETLRARSEPMPVLPGRPAYSMGFDPDGRLLAIGDGDGAVALVDAATGHVVRRLGQHPDEIWALSFSADGRRLATGSYDGTVRLWALPSGRPIGPPITFDWGVRDVSLSPDGRVLMVTSEAGPEMVDVSAPTARRSLSGAEGVDEFARFTPDGRFVLATSRQGWARLWSAATGKPVTGAFGGHSGPVEAATISPDGRTIATGGTDGAVRLWDVRTQRALGAPLPGVPDHTVLPQFTPDGNHLFAITSARRAFRWDVRPSRWAKRACDVAGRPLSRSEWQEALPRYDYAPACAS